IKEFVHEIGVDTATSLLLTSAPADTMVNAVPGTSFAFSAPAAGRAPDAWCCATARTCPVDAWTATISPELDTPSRAARAAFCTVELIVVRTGVPGVPGHRARTPVCAPAELTTTTSVVGVPSS